MKRVITSSIISRTQAKKAAQDLIMNHIATIGYGSRYEEFVEKVGDMEEANAILMNQMDRVAKLMGYDSAWFS